MQLRIIKRSCPKCGEPLILDKSAPHDPGDLQCLADGCGHSEKVPTDISMRLDNAPQLPGF